MARHTIPAAPPLAGVSCFAGPNHFCLDTRGNPFFDNNANVARCITELCWGDLCTDSLAFSTDSACSSGEKAVIRDIQERITIMGCSRKHWSIITLEGENKEENMD